MSAVNSIHQNRVERPNAARTVTDLADKDLLNIFKHLSPHERLLASEVCRRWHGISRMPWSDIIHFDFSSTPVQNIGAIVKLCPNLRTIFASGKTFPSNELGSLSRTTGLRSVQLYNCTGLVRGAKDQDLDMFSLLFSGNLPYAGWEEFVMHDFSVTISHVDIDDKIAFVSLPTSLKRLQLSNVNAEFVWPFETVSDWFYLEGLRQLQNLSCLILSVPFDEYTFGSTPSRFWRGLASLKNLVELCIPGETPTADLIFGLPKLEVLFLVDIGVISGADLMRLTTKHPTLRILVITGHFTREHSIPLRRRFPNGFGSDPLPLLDVFLGKQASEKITFAESPSDAAVIWPITAPLPEFLEKEEIAPLFDGVWIAMQIKQGAKHGAKLWEYERPVATFIRRSNIA